MGRIFQLALITCMICLFGLSLAAQQKTLTGKVFDENNQPLTGATIRVKGTNRAVVTDASGSFSINVSKGETVEITHVGYIGSSEKIGDNATISISLRQSENTMGEVTVVAMDIKRNPRELGYSAQKVTGDQIAGTQRENFLNSLQGRVAGLSITPTSGAAGSSSQIVLRGFNSLTLNNQPLFIVDGIILDNSTLNETSNGGTSLGLASDKANRTSDYTNRISDLNPEDIESVTILKGPEATALYGSQASSGAVVITTKKATPGKTSIQYDDNFKVQFVTRYADLNNNYGIGLNGVSSTAPLSATPGTSIVYFGPAYPAGTKKYDNVKNFFRPAFGQTHNVTADFGTKNAGFRLSSSYYDEDGVIPNNDYKKFNVRLANTTKIGKYVSISPTIQYINEINNKPVRGAGGYLLDLYTWPANNDVRNYQTADGYKKTILAPDYFTEIDNPFFS
ncbi:MAG TPA: TonB-dependent receptor plug domain-containing protein, partial [Chitinophagaceae bacterium]